MIQKLEKTFLDHDSQPENKININAAMKCILLYYYCILLRLATMLRRAVTRLGVVDSR